MKKTFLLMIAALLAFHAFCEGEKKALTYDDILKWERITETHISDNGAYVVYTQAPWKGDGTIKITTASGEALESIECGYKPSITSDSKYLLFTKKASTDSIRALKLKKTKKEDMPQDGLGIYRLDKQEYQEIPSIVSYQVPENWAGWIAYQTQDQPKEKAKAFPLHILKLGMNTPEIYPAVTAYEFAKEQQLITFTSKGDSLFEAGVYVKNLTTGVLQQIYNDNRSISKLSIDEQGERIAFFTHTAKKDSVMLYLWSGSSKAERIVFNNVANIPTNWALSTNRSIEFSDSRLYFGTAPIQPKKDTTILEEEIPVLDVWTWNEDVLQTEQIHNKKRDLKKSYLAAYDIETKKAIQLETGEYSRLVKINKGNSDFLLAYSNKPYAIQTMWEGNPHHNNFYLVHANNGTSEMIIEDCRARPSVSPGGKYIYWYNAIDTTWNTYDIANKEQFTITTPGQVQVANELNDIPNPPSAYGEAGWLDNDEALIIYDRFDVWKISPTNEHAPISLTVDGRQKATSYRVVRFNAERQEPIDASEQLILKARDINTRTDSYYGFKLSKTGGQKVLYTDAYQLGTPTKAKDADVVIFTKEDFETYPNLWSSNLSFKKQTQISNAAPQQEEFNWGTAELISWRSLDGRVLEGTIHKPENFDPNKKYPLIVNFYEKSSDRLTSYRMPENHRSTIDYHYYTSNGYVVFNPDIYYKEGYPGESAFNCVMPGVQTVVALGYIDEERIGAQGHSWGGYQVAYLATRTDMFAAIESGAPVVNMFSAYGGIRWGSGKNRSFQYEHTQSRIGKTIWESPLRYIENSPLFTLDKVNTPILIMHNDDDGAVPWYQGIEYFIGLRRLGKPCWMLNYNNADHWPTTIRDKHDFQIRLAQFFDHYLKGEPMPTWMKHGIPATKKGIEMGYELIDK